MKFKIILSIVILTMSVHAVGTNNTRGLFLDAAAVQTKQSSRIYTAPDSSIKRFRYIDINATLLPQRISTNTTNGQGLVAAKNVRSQALFITLNLFNNRQYVAKITKIAKSSATSTTIWSGTIVGMKHSHVSIASTNGIFAGSVRTDDGVLFKIIYSGGGVHIIEEVDELKLPKERQPLEPQISRSAGLTVPSASIDSGNIIDVMVVYTAAARIGAGGKAAMESIINASVATMNTTFSNSNIATQVRLVHAAEVAYSHGETGFSSGFNTALNDLTNTTDGYMDNIHALRDTYHADMVQLLFNNSSSGGLAWVMTTPSAAFEANAFSVVHYAYADGLAFDHELGHNMGMVHDRLNADFSGSYSYSYGYQSPTNAWHSIMAYACAGGCPRIDYWANPAVTYGGESTGSLIGAADEADAHATITNNLSIIANWRVSPIPTPDLVVNSVTLSNTSVITGQTISLQASVFNQGNAIANSTTLRYFLSDDVSINTSDTELSNVLIASLSAGNSSLHSVNITAPFSAGTYYLGACVDSVNTELATINNCSSGIEVVVLLDTDGDGIANNVDTDDDNDGILDTVEIANGLNPLNASDAQTDLDNDSFSNIIEIGLGTDIHNINSHPTWTPVIMGDIVIFIPSFL